MNHHTQAHAIDSSLCSCSRAERLARCVVCGRNRDHFSAKALTNDWDTCGQRCWSALLTAQRQAHFPEDWK
jgi:hypothetical protein